MKKFNEIFKIGIEVEGSFYYDNDTLKEVFGSTRVKYDGSIDDITDRTSAEIVSPILTNINEEKEFIKKFQKISDDGVFAVPNSSAGTHIHISTLQAGRLKEQHILRSFDSLKFEKMFFEEYFKNFKLRKFASRLHNSYCRPLAKDDILATEEGKNRRDRYQWLNILPIYSNAGIELRIYPYVITTEGLSTIVSFTKKVWMKYYRMARTQKLIEKFKIFEKIKDFEINLKKLNTIEYAMITRLKLTSIRPRYVSADAMEYLVDLYTRKPSVFIQES